MNLTDEKIKRAGDKIMNAATKVFEEEDLSFTESIILWGVVTEKHLRTIALMAGKKQSELIDGFCGALQLLKEKEAEK